MTIDEAKEAFESRINKKLMKDKWFSGVILKTKKGDGFLGKCKNGKFEIYMPVTLGASGFANKFGSCIYGHYFVTNNGLALTYRFGRTLAARLDTLLITILLASGLFVACTENIPALIPVIVVAYIVYLALFLRVPSEDKEELLWFIQGQG